MDEKKTEINAWDENGMTPLHYAVENNDVDRVNLLIMHGADPSLENRDGQTPIELTKDSVIESILICNYPIDWGEKMFFPLHEASSNNNLDLAKLLLNNGAYVNAPNGLGQLPLYFATHNSEMHELLLNAGGKYRIASEHIRAKMPSILSPYRKKMRRFSKEQMADNIHSTTQNESLDTLEALLGRPGDFSVTT